MEEPVDLIKVERFITLFVQLVVVILTVLQPHQAFTARKIKVRIVIWQFLNLKFRSFKQTLPTSTLLFVILTPLLLIMCRLQVELSSGTLVTEQRQRS